MRLPSLAIAALGLLSFGCTAHAPMRTVPSRVETSVDRLGSPEGRREAAGHAVEVHPGFTLAFVELDDQGHLWDRAQLELLSRTLDEEARRPGYDGVLIGVFVHGWQHDASLCDQNVACFRSFLTRMALDVEAISRASGGRVKARRVVGVYVGWRGRSGTVPALRELTFGARHRVALRIGAGDLIEVLTRLDLFVRRMNAVRVDRARMVTIAHSFGGTMTFAALSNILKSRVVEALARQGAAGEAAPVIEGFGDLVVLVNPAFEASLYESLHQLSLSFRRFSPAQAPVLIIGESETDRPNGIWFPLGRTLETLFQNTARPGERKALRTAVGNYEAFVGYRLEAASPGASATPTAAPRASCACTLPLEDAGDDYLMEIAGRIARLGMPERLEVPAPSADPVTRYGRAMLTRHAGIDPANPFWVVRASDEIVHGHSGFFTNGYVDFVRGVVIEAVTRRAAAARER